VNSNPPHDGTDQFFQWLAVDPATGAANVIFYDRRLDPRNQKTTVTLARSTDGGRTFANYAWTRDAFIPHRDNFLGDYIGVAALNNKVYGAWAEMAPPTPKESAPPKEPAAKGPAPPKEKDGAQPPAERHPQTIVRVGVADFGSSSH